MTARSIARVGIAGLAAAIVLVQPAFALLNLDEGRNRINVSGMFSYGYDSNLFASNGGAGDTYANAALGMNFSRHAGLLGVEAKLGISANKYAKFTSEDFANPSMDVIIDKPTGRTQGTLSLSAQRQSRADSAANLRNESWAYSTGLSLNYRVIGRYSLRPSFSFSLTDFTDNTIAVDLASYSLGTDVFYILSTTRDLLASYRVRLEETSVHTHNYDHSVSIGMSGKIISGFNGQVRMGYSLRQPSGPGESSYQAWTANANMGWSLTKRWNVGAQVAKDFSTTSTNVSVDALSTSVSTQYTLNSKTSVGTGLGWSNSRFLGPTANGRRDSNYSWNVSASRVLRRSNRGNINASFSYVYAVNTSTDAISDFSRSTASASVSSSF